MAGGACSGGVPGLPRRAQQQQLLLLLWAVVGAAVHADGAPSTMAHTLSIEES